MTNDGVSEGQPPETPKNTRKMFKIGIRILYIILSIFLIFIFYRITKLPMTQTLTKSPYPVLFLCHGGPNTALETQSSVYKYWQSLSKQLPEKPKKIIVFSGHYQTSKHEGVGIMYTKKPKTIYDFGGFDRKLYSMKYEAPSDLELAEKIKQLLDEKKIKNFLDEDVGYDHGTWIPLKVIYPGADIPVVVVSTLPNDPKANMEIGKALAPLREEGVLILCSGHVVHNLREMFRDWGNPNATEKKWSKSFNDGIKDLVESSSKKLVNQLLKWKEIEGAEMSVPSDDHFAPLFVASGAIKEDDELHGKVLFSEHTIAKFPQNVFIFN